MTRELRNGKANSVSPGRPKTDLEGVPACPVCGSVERFKLYEGLADLVFRCVPWSLAMYQCCSCGSGYLDPRPSVEAIHLAYQNYYTHQPISNSSHPLTWTARSLVSALLNDYRNKRFGGNSRPALAIGRFIVPLVPRYKNKIEHRLRYLPRLKVFGRLLDVGCGNCDFLRQARSIGWEVCGVDPDPEVVAIGHSNGLDVRQGGVEEIPHDGKKFDVVTINHVIEHVHDPVALVKQVYNALKSGGHLFIETPNMDALGHKRFGQYWRGLEAPRHLIIFTWGALENLLVRSGFQIAKRIRRPGTYRDMAAKSRALAQGRDSYAWKRVTMEDKVMGMLSDVHGILTLRNSEFITIIAKKP